MTTKFLLSGGIPLLASVIACFCVHAKPLPRSTPEAEGISSQAIVEFVEAADKNVNTFDSFMILRHGKVIAEGWWKPNSADKPHIMNSVSKSFNSTAVGLAIQKHKLKLDDPVLKFFPADAPPNPSDKLKDRSEERRVGKECRSRWSPY